MGSGASTAKRRTSHNRELGLRFQHQIEMSKAQPRKSFLNRIIHYGSASERSKERWETLSSDFTGNQPKKIRSLLFERQLSTRGPTQRQLHLAQTQDENLVGKSMERDDFGYDPLLVFELDCKSLAAVVMQRPLYWFAASANIFCASVLLASAASTVWSIDRATFTGVVKVP